MMVPGDNEDCDATAAIDYDDDARDGMPDGMPGGAETRAGPTPRLFSPSPPSRRPPALTPGTLVDRYLVIEHVGSGGLGDVYSAYDTELERKIALKLLRPDADVGSIGDDEARWARMLREGQAMARLNHPNVVTVYDVGVHGHEMFFAMELISGQTLHSWLAARRRGWSEIRDVFEQAGRGLAAAHRTGLIHRDFKLANALVDDDGHVTVLDFGLARVAQERSSSFSGVVVRRVEPTSLLASELTDPGVLLGTPTYMAPELWAGMAASERSDQFAFCVALFRGLYGIAPFDGDDLERNQQAAREGRLAAPPSDRTAPAWLHRVVVRGLSADPAQRFETMDALLAALVTDRRRRRRAWTAVLVAIPLLSLGAAGAAFALRPEPTSQEIDVATQLVNEARAAAARGFYVYPPPDEPAAPTAITKVLELESLTGPAADHADAIAVQLREELAGALVRLGDRYYDRPGGPPFAVDFYALALVFVADHPRARERVTLTSGQLDDLVAKAASGLFTTAELVAAEPLALLSDDDPRSRIDKVQRYFTRSEDAAVTTRSRVLSLLEPADRALARAAILQASDIPLEPTPPVVVAAAEAVPHSDSGGSDTGGSDTGGSDTGGSDTGGNDTMLIEGDEDVVEPSAEDPSPSAGGKGKRRSEQDAQRAREQAREQARLGSEALQRGDMAAASAAFHRALEHDRRNARALGGLSQLHFERGEYDQAVRLGEQATAAAPQVGNLWIVLGDAYFKVLRYDDARGAYQRADQLETKAAKARLERLERLVGK